MGKRGGLDVTEKQIESQIVAYLRARPEVAHAFGLDSARKIHQKYGRGRNKPAGLPDILFMFKGGRAGFIEVKKPGGRLSKEQDQFLCQAETDGAYTLVAFSLEDVMISLDQFRLVRA